MMDNLYHDFSTTVRNVVSRLKNFTGHDHVFRAVREKKYVMFPYTLLVRRKNRNLITVWSHSQKKFFLSEHIFTRPVISRVYGLFHNHNCVLTVETCSKVFSFMLISELYWCPVKQPVVFWRKIFLWTTKKVHGLQ